MDDALQKQEKYKTHDNSEFSRPTTYELILFRFVEDEHVLYSKKYHTVFSQKK
jgi:hypothetical protein